MQRNLLRILSASLSACVLFFFNLSGSNALVPGPTYDPLYNHVEDITFWTGSITETSFEVRGCLQLSNNGKYAVDDLFARQAILSETPDFSKVIFSYTGTFGGGYGGFRNDCDIDQSVFNGFSFGLPGEGYGFGDLFALTPGTQYWFKFSLRFCQNNLRYDWDTCSPSKTFTYVNSVTTAGTKPKPTPSPNPTSTKTKKPTPTPKPSNSPSTNPNEDIDDGSLEGAQISIKKSGSNYRFSIVDAGAKDNVRIVASKKGSKSINWKKITNANGNLSFSTTRNLKNWTVKIYINNELEDTIKIK
jgi:hypothetical protein